MVQLLNNQELLYIIIGILIALLILILTLLIGKRPKRKNHSNPIELPIETIEIDNTDDNDSDSRIDIEQVLGQMQRDIEEQKLNEIKNFEDEQEEKSIISYQELLEKSKKESIKDVIQEPEKEENEIKIEEPIKRFRNTEFISPIFGRLDNDITYPTIPSLKKVSTEEKTKPSITDLEIELEKTIDLAQ